MNHSMAEDPNVRIECGASEGFSQWLAQSQGSLAITTYQAGKVALVGWDGRQLTLLMREFPKPLGLAVSGNKLALVTRHELWLLANAAPLAYEYLEDEPGRYDALYVPRVRYLTGDLHAHDVAYGRDQLWVVNTRFSCLARLSDEFSFEPMWRPPFVTDLVPEDRCHLNGLAMQNGEPKYVTALGTTDTPGGWREGKATGGVILDVSSGEMVTDGLCMPHSPRWYGGQLWALNSGMGELLLVDPKSGRKAVVCALPGYLRGLTFVGRYAVIGMSHVREKHIFGGLPIQDRHEKLQCGVAVVDLQSGSHVGTFEFSSGCTELYDVQFLPGVQRPMLLNADKEAVRQGITHPQSCWWLRKSKEAPLEVKGEAGQAPTEPATDHEEPSAALAGAV